MMDAEEVIARWLTVWRNMEDPDDPEMTVVYRYETAQILDALAAAGLRVVPEDRPAPCVHCEGSGIVEENHGQGLFEALGCPDCQATGFAAPVPALDDDTRREVPEVLLTFAKWADWYLEDGCRRDHHGYCQAHGLDKDCPVGPMREWLAAYLGGTDGR